MPDTPVVCCILGVCCSPESQLAALAQLLADAAGQEVEALDKSAYTSMAKELLSQYDLVPKGVGSAIVSAYRPHF